MNVVSDISIFGSVEALPSTRAGVYRVVVNLAKALIDSGRCNIHFSAFESQWAYFALKHLSSSSEFKNAFLPRFPHSTGYHGLSKRVYDLSDRIAVASGFKKAGLRSARKFNHVIKELFYSDTAIDESLQAADIYHSPYFPIPQRVRNYKKIKSFLTVHDLIPILYPQFFDLPAGSGSHYLKDIMEGIGPDDWVVCVSQKTKDDLCNFRKELDPRRIFVTYLGASDWFRPCRDELAIATMRSKYKIPPGRYILSVCTLEPRKNLAHLIQCFAQIIQQERLSELHLVLVGNLGWKYESIFSELTAAHGLRDRIIVTGFVADEDMAALYSDALFFVYPSLYEGFGLPPLEAMQCGVPVITSNTSSLPEVVGEAGILVSPQDKDALCHSMLQLWIDENLRETMSQKSLMQAKKFSWTECASQTLNAYQAAVNLV